MIDWDAHIDDLMHLLSVQHAINDRLAIEVLLSAAIACPRTCASWIILETPWHDRRFENAWFGLGGNIWRPTPLKKMRSTGSAKFKAIVDQWLEGDEAHLFIEPECERYVGCCFLSEAPLVQLRSLRIRVPTTRNAGVLRTLDWHARQREDDKVRACVETILEDRIGARPDDPPKFIQPPWFLFYAELLQRLNPWFIDWRVLLITLAGIAVRHAYLHGLTETGPQQSAVLARVAADSIPPWIANALCMLLDKGLTPTGSLIMSMGLRTSGNPKYGALHELHRLRQNGIIDAKRDEWFIIGEFREGIEFLLTGRAFGMLANCA